MELGSLPQYQQVVVAMLVLVVSGIWAVTKFLKPFIDNISPKPATANGATDAVVISAALADAKPIRELTETVDKLNGNVEELILCQRSGNLEMKLLTEQLARYNAK